MPKIKIKNIPDGSIHRICYKNDPCGKCPFYMKEKFIVSEDVATSCMIVDRYDRKENVLELSNDDFPTNREWIEGLSNEDLAAFYTHGLIIEKYSPFPINIHQIIGNFTSSQSGIKEWLSKPCVYLIEREKEVMKDKFDQIIEDLKNNKQPQIHTDNSQSDKNIEGTRLVK